MVIKEDGTKWACQSCLKGHRVSGCTHTDRELTLVPKKGRPVTQCHHCRLERKKRSAHVKCDCGEVEKPHHPKEKCIHLREAEERAKAGLHEEHHEEKDPVHLAAVAEEQGCCCHHGGKCTCSLLKREPDADKGSSPPHGPAVPKPRLDTTRSDGSITVFANGHHKPVHRKNFAAHECGMPYKMPISRQNSGRSVANAARRSVDSLALDNNMAFSPSDFNYQAGMPFQSEPRRSQSGEASPARTHGSISSSVDFANNIRQRQSSNSIISTANDATTFPPFGTTSSIAENSFDPWSAFPSDSSTNNNTFGTWPNVFENGSAVQPALTAASSGTHSEIDEMPSMDDFYNVSMPIIQEDMNIQGNFIDDSNANRRSLPPGFFGNVDFSIPPVTSDVLPPGMALDSIPPRSKSGDISMGFLDTWQSPTTPSGTNDAQRSTMSTSGRPASQSVGPSSAPGEDMIRQLFPDIDFANNPFGMSNSPTMGDQASWKRLGGLPFTSAPMDTNVMDSMSAFAQPSWTDGSMSMPNDDFPNYNQEPTFSNPNFANNWQFQ